MRLETGSPLGKFFSRGKLRLRGGYETGLPAGGGVGRA